MNARLLFPDKSIIAAAPDSHSKEDLELSSIAQYMAGGDSYIKETVFTLFATENQCSSREEILYRQEVLADCMQEEEGIRSLYRIIADAVAMDRDTYLSATHKKAKYMLDVAVKVMLSMKAPLVQLCRQAEELFPACRSQGLQKLLSGLVFLFDTEKLDQMESIMRELSPQKGMVSAASLGKYLKADGYHPFPQGEGPQKKLLGFLKRDKTIVEFDVDLGDQEASPALSRLKDSMSSVSASLVVQSRNELFDFLKELKRELSFYISCLNLKKELDSLGIPVCMPEAGGVSPHSPEALYIHFSELYNVSLSLQEMKASVPADLTGSEEQMIIITGSNQGGKTSFLRSLGAALLMMSAGMFVCARSFLAPPGKLFTHFTREEDESLKSGKLDEELVRMSSIVSLISPGDWLLMNESFASTNEEEGSEIAMEIISALYDQGVHIVYVTHFYHLVRLLRQSREESVLFLNAGRDSEGNRTFLLQAGEPEVRGYGEDLYREIFC